MDGACEVRLLEATVRVVGPSWDWRPPTRSAWLLAYLAIEGPTSRDRLAGLLWPERPQARARANLRQALMRLRRFVPLTPGETVALAPGVRVDLDRPNAPGGADDGAPTLLSGLAPIDAPALEAWLDGRRAAARAARTERLEQRLRHARDAGDLRGALELARRLCLEDPWSETAARQWMEVALAAHDPATAVAAYRRLRTVLDRDLGLEPSPETAALAQHATRVAVGALRRGQRSLGGGAPVDAPPSDARAEGNARGEGDTRPEEAAPSRDRRSAGEDAGHSGRLWIDLAWLEHRRGRRAAAVDAVRRGLEELSTSGTHQGVADAHFLVGSLAWADGDLDGARSAWEAAIRALPDAERDGAATLRFNLGLVEDALGNATRARSHYLAALPLAEARGDGVTATNILNNLGAQCVAEGRIGAARTLLRRAHALAVRHDARVLQGYTLDSLARADLAGAGVQVPDRPHGRADAPAPPATASAVAAAGAPGSRIAGRVERGDESRVESRVESGDGRADEAAGEPLQGAVAMAARSWTIAREARDVALEIEASLTLAYAHATSGDPVRARRFGVHALGLAQRAGWGASLRRVLWCLADLHGRGDRLAVATLSALAADAADGWTAQAARERLQRWGAPSPATAIAAVVATWLRRAPDASDRDLASPPRDARVTPPGAR